MGIQAARHLEIALLLLLLLPGCSASNDPATPETPMGGDGGSTGLTAATTAGHAGGTSGGGTPTTAGMSSGEGSAAVGETGDPAGASSSAGPGPTTGGVDAERTAAEAMAAVGIGWNLGNSLDVPDGETAWGNPPVSEALIQAVADAGFGGIRIPVTWSLRLGPGPEYTIDPAWLDRVEEVVGFATERDLYAIINLHHDGADGSEGVEWLTLNDSTGAVTDANNAQVAAQFTAVWQQIAARFAAHDHRLVFESMNEIHDGYGEPQDVYFEIINDLNQVFVDLVRDSGGNNATRYLVVPGYNTNIDHTLEGFEAPVDTVEDRLILSVHYYDPYLFTLEGDTPTWGADYPTSEDWGQEDFVLSQFAALSETYVQQGLPVIIGEYGATHVEESAAYRRYYMEFVTKAAVDAGLVPFYWDNGGLGSGPDKFGLFDRTSNEVAHPDVLEVMMRAAREDYAIEDIVAPAG